MNVIHLDPKLSERIEALKNSGEDVEAKIQKAVNKAVRTILEEWVDQKLDEERAAFEAQHPHLVTAYLGKYVAFHQGQLIDTDESERQLYIRVRQQFPDTVVAIFPVDETSQMRVHYSTNTRLASAVKEEN
jgi:hypothetical protein